MNRSLAWLRTGLGTVWFVAQIYVLFYPPIPMLARPLHVMMAIVIIDPVAAARRQGRRAFARATRPRSPDPRCLVATTIYYVLRADYLTERMENVDPVLPSDLVFGVLTLLLLCEATRRVLGWNLLSVILVFVAYAWLGPYLPGWMHFAGFSFPDFIEIMTMAGHGVFGITTETSLTLVFYFLAFSAIYSVVGGTELFMDLALKLVGRAAGRRRQGGGGVERAVRHGERLGGRQCHRNRLVHHPADDPHRLQPRMGRRARGDRLDRRAAHAAGHGHRGVRHGRHPWRALRQDRARRDDSGTRLFRLALSPGAPERATLRRRQPAGRRHRRHPAGAAAALR